MTGSLGYTEADIEEFKEAFAVFDKLGDGKIPCRDVGELLRALGQNPTEADIARVLKDQDIDERMSFETFLPILHDISQKPIKVCFHCIAGKPTVQSIQFASDNFRMKKNP